MRFLTETVPVALGSLAGVGAALLLSRSLLTLLFHGLQRLSPRPADSATD